MKNKTLALTIVSSCALIFSSCGAKPAVKKYNIIFQNDDGTVLQESKVKKGDTPVYEGADPTKASTAEYSYTWNGWDPAIAPASQDQTYTATYQSTKRSYTIRFVDEDGTTVLDSQVLEYGATPVYAGQTPEKAATAQYSYTFGGWSPAISSVVGDATYTATFQEVLRSYSITFKNGDGSNLEVKDVAYGQVPATALTPTKESTVDKDFTFDHWDPEITAVTGEAIYTPVFRESARAYTITFQYDDGTVIESVDVAYGTVPQCSFTPEKESTAQYSYAFSGWDPAPVAVTGEATYVAQFDSTVRSYTIKFLNGDGSDLDVQTLPYGSVPSTEGVPTLTEIDGLTYEHTGWDPAISAVAGNATYYPTFNYQLDGGEKAADYSVNAANMALTQDVAPAGFTQVYASESGINSGACGVSLDITKVDKLFFALSHTASYAKIFGGANDNVTLWTGDWYLVFMERVNGGNWTAKVKKCISGDWVNAPMDEDRASSNNLSSALSLINFSGELNSATIKCTEVYAVYSEKTVLNYGGDTTKISVVNGTVGLPGNADYSIISNGYGTNDTSLVVTGNANPGAAVVTLPLFNFNEYTEVGNVSFKFGVSNNSEHMYFGSVDDKIDLGTNAPDSQSNNNNGYVNWELIVVDGFGYVHNTYSDTNIVVPLTDGMLNGTENIVLSGGGTSIYRRYLFCDFVWKLNVDYPLVAPTTPLDVYSYAGDTTELGVAYGTAKLPGNIDYSIISNGYGTDSNSMCVEGSGNPDSAVLTLPAFNMKPYISVGKISFKFGVKNNNEKMYFGNGDDKIDLGTNAPDSQSNNNNGYINWEMVISAEGAYVHNTYTDQNYNVTLTDGMLNGTEGIVIRGGGASVYRIYFVTDFYWHA